MYAILLNQENHEFQMSFYSRLAKVHFIMTNWILNLHWDILFLRTVKRGYSGQRGYFGQVN
jgi:hypothetical protein